MQKSIAAGLLAGLISLPLLAKPHGTVSVSVTRQQHPVDCAAAFWSALPAQERQLVAGSTVITKQWSYLLTANEGALVVVTVSPSKLDGQPICRRFYWIFLRQGGSSIWEYKHSFGGRADIDRLGTDMDVWCETGTTFPPTCDASVARDLYQQLLQVPSNLSTVCLWPTMDTLMDQQTGEISRSAPARSDNRDLGLLADILERWQRSPETGPQRIGLTKTPYDTILYCDDGTRLWGFQWRNAAGRLVLSDWRSKDEEAELGRARMCTVSVIRPTTATGGMGSQLRLSEIDSASGQQLIRFTKNIQLNNQPETFAHFGAEVSEQQRREWWNAHRKAIERVSLNDIVVTQISIGLVRIEFPASSGAKPLQCKLLPDRIQIVGVQTGSQHVASSVRTQSKPGSRQFDISLPMLEALGNPVLWKEFTDACLMNVPATPTDRQQANTFYKQLAEQSAADEDRYLPKTTPNQWGSYARQLGLSRGSQGVYILWIASGDASWTTKSQAIHAYRLVTQGGTLKTTHEVGRSNLVGVERDYRQFINRFLTIKIDQATKAQTATPVVLSKESEARHLVQLAISSAKLGDAKQYFCTSNPGHGKLLAFAKDLSVGKGKLTSDSLYFPLSEGKAFFTIIEQRADRYREAVFFIDHSVVRLYNFDLGSFVGRAEIIQQLNRQRQWLKEKQ
ncbi:MAG: hypothetical protein AAB701_01605 [Patescibacteria group bacterium]